MEFAFILLRPRGGEEPAPDLIRGGARGLPRVTDGDFLLEHLKGPIRQLLRDCHLPHGKAVEKDNGRLHASFR